MKETTENSEWLYWTARRSLGIGPSVDSLAICGMTHQDQRCEDFRHATDKKASVLEGDVEFAIAGRVHHTKVGEELLIPAAER